MKYLLDEKVPHCLECGDPIPYGRGDRKFCSAGCKNRHHNREARRWRFRYARIIGILEKNHDILKHLVQLGIRSISKAELAQLGYRADFVTSCNREARKTVCHCFDIVFRETETKIVKLAEEPNLWFQDDPENE